MWIVVATMETETLGLARFHVSLLLIPLLV
jgi:hypothetical protein